MKQTFKQRDGQQVTAPAAIRIPMEIGDVRVCNGRDGRPCFQIHGHVQDYGVTVWMTEAEARAVGIRVA